ncbi:MAG: hypothetical protein ACE5KI_07985, partial [Dehalococcoidia bacterium]
APVCCSYLSPVSSNFERNTIPGSHELAQFIEGPSQPRRHHSAQDGLLQLIEVSTVSFAFYLETVWARKKDGPPDP